MCCVIPAIPDLGKPANTSCAHLAGGLGGCTIYQHRPGQCRAFRCLWLDNEQLGEELWPERCGVAFEVHRTERLVVALVDPDRYEELEDGPAHELMRAMVADGFTVWVVCGEQRFGYLAGGVSAPDAMGNLRAAWSRINGRCDLRH
jgi:hypothetical protein